MLNVKSASNILFMRNHSGNSHFPGHTREALGIKKASDTRVLAKASASSYHIGREEKANLKKKKNRFAHVCHYCGIGYHKRPRRYELKIDLSKSRLVGLEQPH